MAMSNYRGVNHSWVLAPNTWKFSNIKNRRKFMYGGQASSQTPKIAQTFDYVRPESAVASTYATNQRAKMG
jgi:hypothetical protein